MQTTNNNNSIWTYKATKWLIKGQKGAKMGEIDIFEVIIMFSKPKLSNRDKLVQFVNNPFKKKLPEFIIQRFKKKMQSVIL